MTPVNENDLLQIEALGFSLPGDSVAFLAFLRKYLPDLRLKDFVGEIDNQLSPPTSTALCKELYFFEKEPPMLMLQYFRRTKTTKRQAWVLRGLLLSILPN